MIDDWQEIQTAPKNEPVLICPTNCKIIVGILREGNIYESTGKTRKGWVWRHYENENGYNGGYRNISAPKMWRPVPLPPKHLYERKLTADLLEKQVQELRGETTDGL